MDQVFMTMSSDVIHNGHINIIQKAAELGQVTVGVTADETVNEYQRFPLLPFEERCRIIEGIKGVERTVKVTSLDATDVILSLKPDIVVHGDDWKQGLLAPVRTKVVAALDSYGGRLVEFPYTKSLSAEAAEVDARRILQMPEHRRARLRQLLAMETDRPISVIETHNGLTGLIAEKTFVEKDGGIRQFDAMWVSSLTDSTAKGKPDTELVDNTSRLETINEIMEVTTKPIILDGDSGGLIEHFQYLVGTLERTGVSAIIIEDKIGLKRNSLFGADAGQQQDTIEHFCAKIAAGKSAQSTADFMIIARIESLILEQGMDDAITRARAYVNAGADGIMIHSRKPSPDEIFEFVRLFREEDPTTPIVVVPTTFNMVTAKEFKAHDIQIVIYANHLIRSAFPAMRRCAEMILDNDRCLEAGEQCCMPIKEILTLIPPAD